MADLRERLEVLVREMQEDASPDGVLIYPPDAREAAARYAKRLAAILAESEEPKRCRQCDGILSTPTCGLCAGQTHYVGDDCPGGHAEVGEMLPAKLPLGHEFRFDAYLSPRIVGRKHFERCGRCGQPRSAHEPPTKPTL